MHTKKIKFCMQKKKFRKNICLRTKFDLRLKKKHKKIFGKFSKLLRNWGRITYLFLCVYGNCMVSIFFKKKLNSIFFVRSLFNCSQKAAEMV